MSILIVLLILLQTLVTAQGIKWRENESLFRAGFRIGMNFPFTRGFSDDWTSTRIFSPDFGGYFRVGEIVFGEAGIGYTFQKNRFAVDLGSGAYDQFDEVVEMRFLQIPIRAVGEFRIKKIFSLQPALGFIYQPLLQVSDNLIGFSKNNLTNHYFILTAGLGFAIYFFTFELSFRQFLQNWMPESRMKKPSYLHFALGFQI
jgi:hypothetical protein